MRVGAWAGAVLLVGRGSNVSWQRLQCSEISISTDFTSSKNLHLPAMRVEIKIDFLKILPTYTEGKQRQF